MTNPSGTVAIATLSSHVLAPDTCTLKAGAIAALKVTGDPDQLYFSLHTHVSTSGPGLNEAAFSLHQATERLYHCVLLVRTFYAPHVHNLGFLRT